MASTAHAFFCFEVLAAAFEETEHCDLQTLLSIYEDSTSANSVTNAKHNDKLLPEITDAPGQTVENDDQRPPQIPSISRLQSSEPSSRSMSSSPSSISLNSSTSQLTNSTATSMTNPVSYASQLSITESYPLFVTWNTISSSGQKSLRGCIGTFEALPLEKGLEQYALTSAFEDTRFSPIPAVQLPKLSCSLTLLADFEECSSPLDWTLGTHGIRISFSHRSRRHGATYLPDVAVEQGWTKEETLESLMRKAGWDLGARRLLRASSRPWEDVKDFRVVRYTGLKASATYDEWQEWRRGTKLALAQKS